MKHFSSRTLIGSALAAATFIPSSALACGGFFCDTVSPINQAAERIIFAKDGDQVTQIVEVAYQGDPEKFSWVLPVPGKPVPGLSSAQVFDRLQGQTNPTYQLNRTLTGECDVFLSGGVAQNDGGDGDAAPEQGPTVTVIDAGSIGRFDYETISVTAADAEPADVAVRWLTDNGYEVGPMGREVLGPYLKNGLNLIAFKLQPGADEGAIRPISLKYNASEFSIPIKPTAVAANADMPILVWVLGDHRAVPTNYRGLELNELLIDWFNPAGTYNQVVTAAANEAGGQGFVTEMAALAAPYADIIAPLFEKNAFDKFSEVGLPLEDVVVGLSEQFSQHDGFVEVVGDTLSLRAGVTANDFASCPSCYFYPGQAPGLGFGGAPGDFNTDRIPDTDPIFSSSVPAFVKAIEDEVLMPIADTAALFEDLAYVTRLYTTMSADEMTLDPIFNFNPDLDDVSNVHAADQLLDCGDDTWVITLPSGEEVRGSGSTWPYALDNTDLPFNTRILQYSTSGQPEVIKDNSATILSIHNSNPAGDDSSPVSVRKRGGFCAVEQGPADQSPWVWLVPAALGGVWFARRRQVAPARVK